MLFKFFQGENGEFYFNILGENNKVMATSEGYTRAADARRGAHDLTMRIITFSANVEPGGEDVDIDDPAEMQRKGSVPRTMPNIFDAGLA